MSDQTGQATTGTVGQTTTAPGQAEAPKQGQAGAIPTAPTGTVDKAPGLTSQAAQEAMKKFKVKVDGQELEVEESELLRGYSHQKAANKALQEGKAAKKQAEEFITMMKDKAKLFDTLRKLGHDPRQLSEEYLASVLADEMLDPRDRELKETKAKLAQRDEMDKRQQEEIETRRNTMLKEKYAKDFNTQFVEALNSSGLPPTKPMVAEMAKYVGRAAQLGFKMTPSEAAQLVKEDLEKFTRSVIGATDGDMLVKLLGGDEVVNKIRKWDTSRLKSPEDLLKTPQEQGERKARSPANRRMTHAEWRDFNRKK